MQLVRVGVISNLLDFSIGHLGNVRAGRFRPERAGRLLKDEPDPSNQKDNRDKCDRCRDLFLHIEISKYRRPSSSATTIGPRMP